MTNFEFIKNMSIDDMAVMITTIIHERDVELQRQFVEKSGLDIDIVEIHPEIQAAIHKAWLESEVDDNE